MLRQAQQNAEYDEPQLRRNLPHHATAEPTAAISAAPGCRAVDIPRGVKSYPTESTRPVIAAGKVVEISFRPAASGGRQVKYRALSKVATGT